MVEYECGECGRGYTSSQGVLHHRRTHHPETFSVTCPSCDELFDTEKGMQYHHTVTHGESLSQEEYTCEECGDRFQRTNGRNRGENDFCTQRCYWSWRRGRFTGEEHWNSSGYGESNCEMCSEGFEHVPSIDRQFCSSECRDAWRWLIGPPTKGWGEGKAFHVCEECGVEYPDYSTESRFCSKRCMDKWRSGAYAGEKHHNWKGGVRRYYGENWLRIRKRIRERDGHECRSCGTTADEIGRALDVHHIVPFSEFDDTQTANDPDNLVTLCRPCHNRVERGIFPVP